MPKRLTITVVCFHITAAFLGLAAVALAIAGPAFYSLFSEMTSSAGQDAEVMRGVTHAMSASFVIGGLFLLGAAVGIELVVRGLNRRQYWAWIVGLVICGLLIVSGLSGALPSLILGGLALWGLVDPNSVTAFRPTQNGN